MRTRCLLLVLLAGCTRDGDIRRLNAAPELTLASPLDGDVFRHGEGNIAIIGTVSDSYDTAADIALTLTVGGAEIGVDRGEAGAFSGEVDPASLTLGEHEITAAAEDTDGKSATVSVRIQVAGPFGAPEVTITAPLDGVSFELGDSVTFQGSATDSTTLAADLEFAWSSSEDGPLPGAISADGDSVLVTSALSAGVHTITLSATDLDGETGSASVELRITDPPVVAEPGDLVFSEMMVNPQVVDDELGEWVELWNASSHPIDLAGYSLHDDDIDAFVLAGPLVVAAGDYVVLCADLDLSDNGGVPCDGWFLRDWNGGGLALANGEDELVLSRPDGVEIDWVHYDDTWFEPGIAIGVRALAMTGGLNDDVSAWCNQTSVVSSGGEPGTPGMPNDPCP
jgi:hypothetical protein